MSKILLSIPDDLLKAFDTYAKGRNYERSELMRTLIREKVYPEDILNMADSSTVERRPVKADAEGSSPSLPAGVGNKATRTISLGNWGSMEEKVTVKKGWCQLHFEKGKEYELTHISWEDENGKETVKDKWACNSCLTSLEQRGYGKVIYL